MTLSNMVQSMITILRLLGERANQLVNRIALMQNEINRLKSELEDLRKEEGKSGKAKREAKGHKD